MKARNMSWQNHKMTRGGNLVAFDVTGGQAEAFSLANALQMTKISNNLGDAKTLITHPATTTHAKLTAAAQAELGLTPASLRISIGLEEADDLISDFQQALAQI